MPPLLALFLCILFMLYLIRTDSKRGSRTSRALWLPLLWMLIIGSRPVALWIRKAPVLETGTDLLSGNPIDRTIFLILIFIAVLVLSRRSVRWSRLLRKNLFIFMFIAYCGMSVAWSDFPFVSFKRWIKEIGNIVMVCVILTDSQPVEAAKTVLRRCAYILVPLSVVLIKYYLNLSRSYNPWTGEGEFIGVATSKNMLGILCLVFGLFFVWNTLSTRKDKHTNPATHDQLINLCLLGMIIFLFIRANSVACWTSFVIGILTLSTLWFLKNNLRYLSVYIFVFFVCFIFILVSFDLTEFIILHSGRDLTLTGRTELWKDLFSIDINPFIGTGYESFWLGNRLEILWENYWWRPNQSHNGYLETYLNLGVIGLFLFIGLIVASYRKIREMLFSDFEYGTFRMAFLAPTSTA